MTYVIKRWTVRAGQPQPDKRGMWMEWEEHEAAIELQRRTADALLRRSLEALENPTAVRVTRDGAVSVRETAIASLRKHLEGKP